MLYSRPQWKRGCSVSCYPAWELSPVEESTAEPVPNTETDTWSHVCVHRNMLNIVALFILGSTCDMTSSDQLSPMVMGCVGFVGILLSFSAGRSRVGPNTVARLCRDILFTLSFSAILTHGERHYFIEMFYNSQHVPETYSNNQHSLGVFLPLQVIQ